MRIKFKPYLRETVTTAVAFAGTSPALPQAALGQRPSDAYKRGATRLQKLYRRTRRRTDESTDDHQKHRDRFLTKHIADVIKAPDDPSTLDGQREMFRKRAYIGLVDRAVRMGTGPRRVPQPGLVIRFKKPR